MSPFILVPALGTAVAAAVASTWSPCGQSMLSTITPLGERSRGCRYELTVAWFIVGAVLGGIILGLGAGLLAAGTAALGISEGARTGVAALAALAAAGSDLRWLGFALPVHHRQVNERWLDRYRSWLYGGGFGAQIGCGLATYIMTAGVYLMIVLGALTASPLAAVGVCALFGAVRGVAVLATRRIGTPEALYELHRRFDDRAPLARGAVIGVELTVGLAMATVVSPMMVAALAALLAIAAAGHLRARRQHPDVVVHRAVGLDA